ncbi:hypothetical protein FGO68_gene3225 [Halteria grandinella]|uniref:Uncharacterized protein n=1 Tax=Halteria grandinella TaxID=5974 RepID=A0A8J8T621_HALGN|nr:hypothetical protein FGO68_gene3225 [Halteria grandinella]
MSNPAVDIVQVASSSTQEGNVGEEYWDTNHLTLTNLGNIPVVAVTEDKVYFARKRYTKFTLGKLHSKYLILEVLSYSSWRHKIVKLLGETTSMLRYLLYSNYSMVKANLKEVGCHDTSKYSMKAFVLNRAIMSDEAPIKVQVQSYRHIKYIREYCRLNPKILISQFQFGPLKRQQLSNMLIRKNLEHKEIKEALIEIFSKMHVEKIKFSSVIMCFSGISKAIRYNSSIKKLKVENISNQALRQLTQKLQFPDMLQSKMIQFKRQYLNEAEPYLVNLQDQYYSEIDSHLPTFKEFFEDSMIPSIFLSDEVLQPYELLSEKAIQVDHLSLSISPILGGIENLFHFLIAFRPRRSLSITFVKIESIFTLYSIFIGLLTMHGPPYNMFSQKISIKIPLISPLLQDAFNQAFQEFEFKFLSEIDYTKKKNPWLIAQRKSEALVGFNQIQNQINAEKYYSSLFKQRKPQVPNGLYKPVIELHFTQVINLLLYANFQGYDLRECSLLNQQKKVHDFCEYQGLLQKINDSPQKNMMKMLKISGFIQLVIPFVSACLKKMPHLNSLDIKITLNEKNDDNPNEKKKWDQECKSALGDIGQILIDRGGLKQLKLCVPKSFKDINSLEERKNSRYGLTVKFVKGLMAKPDNIQKLKLRSIIHFDQLELMKTIENSKQLKDLAFTLSGPPISTVAFNKANSMFALGKPACSQEQSVFEGGTYETIFLQHVDIVRSLKKLEKVKMECTVSSMGKWNFYALCIPALPALKEVSIIRGNKKMDCRDIWQLQGWTDTRNLLKVISESNSIKKIYCDVCLPIDEITKLLSAKTFPVYFEDRGKKYGFNEFMELHKATNRMHYLNVKMSGLEDTTKENKANLRVPEQNVVDAMLTVKENRPWIGVIQILQPK